MIKRSLCDEMCKLMHKSARDRPCAMTIAAELHIYGLRTASTQEQRSANKRERGGPRLCLLRLSLVHGQQKRSSLFAARNMDRCEWTELGSTEREDFQKRKRPCLGVTCSSNSCNSWVFIYRKGTSSSYYYSTLSLPSLYPTLPAHPPVTMPPKAADRIGSDRIEVTHDGQVWSSARSHHLLLITRIHGARANMKHLK